MGPRDTWKHRLTASGHGNPGALAGAPGEVWRGPGRKSFPLFCAHVTGVPLVSFLNFGTFFLGGGT